MAEDTRIFKVVFYDQGRLIELFAQEVLQGGLFGFLEVQGLVFGTKTEVVIDPAEERLEQEFEGVKRVYIPIHSVVRIDEVEKTGKGRVLDVKDPENVRPFPVPVYTKGKDSG